MARTKQTGKHNPSGRDSGGFVALPWSVIDCPAYRLLSMHAKALLIEIARQYVRDNNGRLLLSMAYMRKRGWNSSSMLAKAKRQLIEEGFIFETVKGHRPNKASWYAITWYNLDKLKGFDEGAEKCYVRSAYRLRNQLKISTPSPKAGPSNSMIAP